MNNDTPHHDDKTWQALLAASASTFSGDAAPPFGFVTSTLARLKAERSERDMFDRIGLRSLFAAFAVLVTVAGLTIGIQLQQHYNIEPRVQGVIQAEDIPIA